MSYDRFSNYVTFGGSIGSPGVSDEVWQFGLKFTNTVPGDGIVNFDVSVLSDMYDLVANFLDETYSYTSSGVHLLWAKSANLDLAGEYTAEATYFEGFDTPGSATALDGTSPQDSICVTLASGQTFGRANYGRFYLPWNTIIVEHDNGVLGTVQLSNMVPLIEDMLNGLNAISETAGGVGTRIRIMSKVGTGTTKDAIQMRVGNVKDTQRRRRNRIAESYTIVTLA